MPARGVERWLAHRLAHRLGASGRGDGVCAHVAFPAPGEVVAAAVEGATGVTADDDPWHPARAVWPLMEVVDSCAGRPWCAPLTAHLGRARSRFAVVAPPGRPLRRLRRAPPRTARRVAGRRRRGRARGPAVAAGGVAGAAHADRRAGPGGAARRRRRRRCGATPGSPPCRSGSRCSAPPACRRTTWPCSPPSPTAATCTCGCRTPPPRCGTGSRRSPTGCPPAAPTPPRSCRATPCSARSAATSASCSCAWPTFPPTDTHHPRPDEPPATLLQRLQRDLRDDAAPGGHELAPGDRSVQVHACHGPHRQVEVLREVVLGLLAADPTLEPRDVLIACPDVETFAPLVSAAFGLDPDGATGHPGHRLAVRLADRALRQVNPLLDVAGRLLELADARLTASEVLDLLAAGPVRRRFGLDGDDLDRLRDLVTRAGVRWGLSAPHRRPYRLDGFPQNTWAAGLDRLLLGVAMEGERWLGTALPLDDVESGDVGRLGRLAEFVDRLTAALDDLSGERPLAAWVAGLVGALDALTATTPADAWQASQARAEFADVAHAAVGTTALTLADVRGLLAERLRGRPGRANFRTGSLTVATMVPMRSVPHRVICLLGLDDGAFPRAGVDDGDDVLARDPAGRRARPAQRRPPAAARRGVRRDRAPRRPLLGRRRADRRPAPARRAAGRAARRRRRDRGPGRRRPGRRAAPPAALRRPQLHRRRARHPRAVQLRPRRAGRMPGRRGQRRRRPRRSSPARCRPLPRRPSRSTTSSPSPSTR